MGHPEAEAPWGVGDREEGAIMDGPSQRAWQVVVGSTEPRCLSGKRPAFSEQPGVYALN